VRHPKGAKVVGCGQRFGLDRLTVLGFGPAATSVAKVRKTFEAENAPARALRGINLRRPRPPSSTATSDEPPKARPRWYRPTTCLWWTLVDLWWTALCKLGEDRVFGRVRATKIAV